MRLRINSSVAAETNNASMPERVGCQKMKFSSETRFECSNRESETAFRATSHVPLKSYIAMRKIENHCDSLWVVKVRKMAAHKLFVTFRRIVGAE